MEHKAKYKTKTETKYISNYIYIIGKDSTISATNNISNITPTTLTKFIFVGTGHIFKKSVEDIKKAVKKEHPTIVAVELDEDRYKYLLEKTKNKRPLTSEEEKVTKELKKDLEEAEEYVKKEIKDIEKGLK